MEKAPHIVSRGFVDPERRGGAASTTPSRMLLQEMEARPREERRDSP